MSIIAVGRKISFGAIRGNLIAFSAGLALTVLLAEGTLRLFGLGHPYYSAPELYRPSADPRVLFTPRAGWDGFSEGTRVQTNALGLRERELPTEKPLGVARLLFLGDSVTFGTGVRHDEAFPRVVEARLSGGGRGEIQAVNAGVVGYNTTQELARLRDVGLDYRPDAVVLTFVVNDLLDAFSIFDHQYEPGGLFAAQKVWLRRNSHLYRFGQNLYWRVALELRRTRSGPTEPLRPRARLTERLAEIREIAETARAHGALFLLVLYPDNLDDPVGPDPGGARRGVREELTLFAEGLDYPLVDLTAALGDVRDPRARELRLREDPHPSPAGHRAIAEALTPALRFLLADVELSS